uniref:stigma-specific STIG1-like protein 3 n=1 Tax=Fragaria vesca subsp. vesca TaxID=101020 RepID=UPI0005CA3E42|nr:PREDICTED: stigma-specific STIG1-like protein 3 [Fragaria vesca subsp. vesca]
MMKLMNVFFTVLLATMTIVSAEYLDDYNTEEMQNTESTASEMQEASTSFRGVSRLLTQQNVLASVTCDKLPRVCHLKKSPGSDCCNKKCVNVKTDRLNCGMCRYKCKYTELCCRGKCVNAMFDKRHCGGCNQKCKRGEFCVYGMCNYA